MFQKPEPQVEREQAKEKLAKEIIRLRKEKEKESNKLFNRHRKNNIGFWNGCIVQTYSNAFDLYGYSMSEIDDVIRRIEGGK